MRQATINGITYNVIDASTPEAEELAGRANLARHMRASNIAESLYVQRPAGRKVFWVYLFGNGRFSSLTAIPGF